MPQPAPTIQEAIAAINRESLQADIEIAEQERRQVLELFPLEEWPSLPLERYALGLETSENSYCRWVEFKARRLGSMQGGSAYKHIIFFKQKSPGGWAYPKEYQNEQEAWRAIRSAFVMAFDLARQEQWAEIDNLEAISQGAALRTKSLHIYFPTAILPVYSREHIRHFLRLLKRPEATDKSYDVVRLNRALLEALREVRELQEWTTLELGRLLYAWVDPREVPEVLKVAPGDNARFWDECLREGFICFGWDKLGDLREYGSKEELRLAMLEHYGEYYKNNSSTVSKKTNEIWTLLSMEPGDVIVANHGTSKVLGVGEVIDPIYEFRPDREEYKNLIHVTWDTSYAKTIPPQKKWAFRTVDRVSATLYDSILSGSVLPPTTTDPRSPRPKKLPVDPLFAEMASALERKGQLILYGPPGTGKTYHARRFAVWWLLRHQGVENRDTVLADPSTFAAEEKRLSTSQINSRVWWMVANPKQWNWDGLFQDGTVEYNFGRLKRNYHVLQPGDLVVGYSATPDKRVVALARVTRGLAPSDAGKPTIKLEPVAKVASGPTYEEIGSDPLLKDSEPMRFHCQGTLFALSSDEAQRLIAWIEDRNPELSVNELEREGVGPLTRVTFHPSYSYEDFIEGFRPTADGSGELNLRLEDGVLKRICREAQANPDGRYLLLIDEINRGNIAKILGEMITLLEYDKRGLPVTLPQSKETFAVPDNVFLLGTMNTADRSIKLLDAALRRRFAFLELMPDPELLQGARVGSLPLDLFLDELNRRVSAREGREKQIGHSFLLEDGQPVTDPAEFARRFRHEILPLLQEYCYDDYATLSSYLGTALVDPEARVLNTDQLNDPESLISALENEFLSKSPESQ